MDDSRRTRADRRRTGGAWIASLAATLLAAGSVAAQAPAADQPAQVTLLGVIREAGSDRTVPSARVDIPRLGLRMQADEEGRFALTGLRGGTTLVLRVEQLGYRPQEVTVLLDEPESPVVVWMDPLPVELEGIEVEARRVYDTRETLERRMDPYRYSATVRGQLDLLTSDAPDMVDYVWEEAKALLVPCPEDTWGWEWACMRFRSQPVPVEVCVDDVTAPGGPAMLHQYAPEDLYRVEVLPDMAQVRLYTRPYIAHLSRTGKVPPIWPRWLGGCMGGDVAWSPPSWGDPGG